MATITTVNLDSNNAVDIAIKTAIVCELKNQRDIITSQIDSLFNKSSKLKARIEELEASTDDTNVYEQLVPEDDIEVFDKVRFNTADSIQLQAERSKNLTGKKYVTREELSSIFDLSMNQVHRWCTGGYGVGNAPILSVQKEGRKLLYLNDNNTIVRFNRASGAMNLGSGNEIKPKS